MIKTTEMAVYDGPPVIGVKDEPMQWAENDRIATQEAQEADKTPEAVQAPVVKFARPTAKKMGGVTSMKTGKGKLVWIPPRIHRVYPKNLVIRLVIPGTIPSKKNCKVPDMNRKKIDGILKRYWGQPVGKAFADELKAVKPYIRNNARYQSWEDRTRPDLVLQAARWKDSYAKDGLMYPITRASISVRYCWADVKSRDNSNKSESIHDTLVACGILSDDDQHCLYKNCAEADTYKDEITKHCTIITITAHEW